MHVYVCLLAWTDHLLKILNKHVLIIITKIELMQLVGEACRAIARVQPQLPGVETDVEAHMATYSLFSTNHQRQVAHRQYKFRSRQW